MTSARRGRSSIASRGREKVSPARAEQRAARSAGSVALQRLGERQIDIAERVQVDQSLVARWGSGERVPTQAQKKLLRSQLGIPIGAWGKPPEAAPSMPTPPPEQTRSTPLNGVSFREETQRLYDETIRLRKRAEFYRDRNEDKMYLKVLREAAVQQTLLGRLLGVTTQISEEKLVRLPVFRNMIDRVLAAVAPWPEALRAIIETLEILEEDSRAPRDD